MEQEAIINWDKLILGESDETVHLQYRQESIDAATRLAEQATRSFVIFSYDLDPTVFNTTQFLDAFRSLATRNQFINIRVLVTDPTATIKQNHRMLEIFRRLSSFISIRETHPDFKNHHETIIVADDRGYMYRKNSSRYEGTVNFYHPSQATAYLNQFDEMWTPSRPSPDFKRLHI